MKQGISLLALTIVLMACNTSKTITNNEKKQKTMETKKIQVAGEKFKVDFGGDFVFKLDFESITKMTWSPLIGDTKDLHHEDITMVEIRPNIYMVHWKENSGNTIVHVEDFQNGKAYTNITTPDHNFYNLNGPLTSLEGAPLSTTKVESTGGSIPVIGNKFQVDFGGDFLFELNFQSATKMTWTPLKGEDRQSHTEAITMTEIRPNVYMIYWQEVSGNKIVHIEDFENGKAYTNITLPDQTFYNLNGPLTLIKE